ncbi:MAG: c-type cytochrome [Alphaproteobacteria bacterium]
MRSLGIFVLIGMTLSGPVLAQETAKQKYDAYCVQCHGLTGNGMGVNVRDMSVQPRDHTDAKSMRGRSDEELFKVIKEGGLSISKSVLMPAWKGTLTDAEITELVGYLRELCDCAFGK